MPCDGPLGRGAPARPRPAGFGVSGAGTERGRAGGRRERPEGLRLPNKGAGHGGAGAAGPGAGGVRGSGVAVRLLPGARRWNAKGRLCRQLRVLGKTLVLRTEWMFILCSAIAAI